MAFVDLHAHSTASDGTFTPTQLVEAAREAGLSALALTDHDTTAGCAEAEAAARSAGIDFLPGIEISCEFPRPGTLHLLGYGVDHHSPDLRELKKRLLEGRAKRNETMVRLMNEAGIPVTLEELLTEAGGATVGRPHLARILIRKGFAKDVPDAFNRYLGQGGKFYVDKEVVTSRRAIEMVHKAGGIAVLAHPVQLRRDNYAQLKTVIKNLADEGLDGVEAIHSDHREMLIAEIEEWARRMGLVTTGGSDFHGSNKTHIKLGRAGRRRIPREKYEAVLARIERRRALERGA